MNFVARFEVTRFFESKWTLPWDSMRIEREGDGLVAHGPETWNPYFPSEEAVALIPVSDDELLLEGKHRFRIRLHAQDGRVSSP